MRNVQGNLNNQEDSDSSSGKKYPISAGTSVFLIFSFLLILGVCKFSFYVLKNHRSAIDRDTLVKTYVDVQPYSGVRNTKSSYIVLRNQDKTVPAPFFINDSLQNSYELPLKKQEEKTAPALILTADNAKKETKKTSIVKRPPVIRTNKTQQKDLLKKVSSEKDRNKENEAVSLDNLMASGLTLLTESDKKIIDSEFLLQDDPVSNENENIGKKEKDIPKKEPAPAKKNNHKTVVANHKKQPEADVSGTRWIDIAQLRKQLLTQKESEIKQEIQQKNKALLEMNQSKQVASVGFHSASDVPEPKNQKRAEQKALSASEKQISENKPTDIPHQTAVVQDIPFAGTKEKAEEIKTAVNTNTLKNTSLLAGDSPSLWKIAKARGNPKNSLAPKEEKVVAEKQQMDTPVKKEETQTPAKATTIYRNGKLAAVIPAPENKSLNWLDRQEAAVWTSMSQSDTPSVWSAAIEAGNIPSDRAKAFRVADEQPATDQTDKKAAGNEPKQEGNIINSSPVRTIGEERKPEAKTDPLLLPLGAPSATNVSTPPQTSGTTQQTYPSGTMPLKMDPNGLSTALSKTESSKTTKENQNSEEDGLVNKFFSFFGKTETDSMPNIGSGTPVEKTPEKEEKEKKSDKKTTKTTKKVSLPAGQSEQTYQKEIVPTELRLTFRPDSSEISAQSVKWIKAFGQRAKKDIQNAVEVRMSTTDPDIQEKRFALIHSILTGVGMEDVQVIPVMTNRTPHTIVLRMIVLPEEGYTEYTSEAGGIKERFYYKQW